jgi:hypothetical protein
MRKPLKSLTNDVLSTEPGISMGRLSQSYRDQEFDQITDIKDLNPAFYCAACL